VLIRSLVLLRRILVRARVFRLNALHLIRLFAINWKRTTEPLVVSNRRALFRKRLRFLPLSTYVTASLKMYSAPMLQVASAEKSKLSPLRRKLFIKTKGRGKVVLKAKIARTHETIRQPTDVAWLPRDQIPNGILPPGFQTFEFQP
jgi:hypothetical protein